MSESTLSLDDTLKELLQEEVEKTPDPVVEKPKRGRRSKAQIEADKKSEDKKEISDPTNIGTVETTDGMKDTISKSNAPMSTAELPKSSAETHSNIQENSAKDPDVMTPEIVENTETDEMPDIVENKDTKNLKEKSTNPFKGATVKAELNKESRVKDKGIIGKGVIFTTPVPIYRAPHLSMRTKSYRGYVTVIEKAKLGFIKVQFLRSGFGLCEGFVQKDQILNRLEGDSNVTEKTST